MESAPRQRLNGKQEEFNEKDPSKLERGRRSDSVNGTTPRVTDEERIDPKNENEPPLTKSKRFQEFKSRLRGKDLERIPSLKDSLIATFRQSCKYF